MNFLCYSCHNSPHSTIFRGTLGVLPLTGAASHFRTVNMLVASRTFPNTTERLFRIRIEKSSVPYHNYTAKQDQNLPCLPSSQSAQWKRTRLQLHCKKTRWASVREYYEVRTCWCGRNEELTTICVFTRVGTRKHSWLTVLV